MKSLQTESVVISSVDSGENFVDHKHYNIPTSVTET